MRELTIKQYAEREQVTPRTVRNWIDKGAVNVRRTPGGGVRVVVLDTRRAEKSGNPSA